MKSFAKLFKGPVALICYGFAFGWILGRGTAVGPQSGEAIIGGVVVALIVLIIGQAVYNAIANKKPGTPVKKITRK